jgi:pimeloyl-ACP methyl ester carboxylesterase
MKVRLILLPGMHGTGELFSEFMSLMSERICIEAPCYPPDVAVSNRELLGAIQSFVPTSDPYFLLAESFSTPLAIQFAATHPENLRGLIIAAGFARSPVGGFRSSLGSLLAPVIFRSPVPRAAVNHLLIGSDAPESLVKSVRAVISSIAPRVMSARLRAVLACDVRRELSEVMVPVLYIRANQDRLIPKKCLEDLQAILPSTTVVELDGPHLILQREPKKSAEAVARFIQEAL